MTPSPSSLEQYPESLNYFSLYHFDRYQGLFSISGRKSSEKSAFECAKQLDIVALQRILSELHELTQHVQQLWKELGHKANISLDTPQQTLEWLRSITAVFQQEWDWRHLSPRQVVGSSTLPSKPMTISAFARLNATFPEVAKAFLRSGSVPIDDPAPEDPNRPWTTAEIFDHATNYFLEEIFTPEDLHIISTLARNDAQRMEQVLDDFFEDKIGTKEVSTFFFALLDKRSPLHVLFSFSAPLLEILKELSRDFAFYDPDLFFRAPDVSHDEEQFRRILTRFQETWQQERWLVVRPLLLQIRHWIQLHLQGLLPAIQLRPLVEELDRDAPPLVSFLAANPPLHDTVEQFLRILSLFEPSALKRFVHHQSLDESAVQAHAKTCFEGLQAL